MNYKSLSKVSGHKIVRWSQPETFFFARNCDEKTQSLFYQESKFSPIFVVDPTVVLYGHFKSSKPILSEMTV